VGSENSLIVPLSWWVGVEVVVVVDPVGFDGTAGDDAPHPLKMATRVRSDMRRSEEQETERRGERLVAMRATPL
jgi:hypothetical protein